MRILPLIVLTISTAAIAIAPKALTQEIQLLENNTFLTAGVPTLVKAVAPHDQVEYMLPKYYFTLDLPADANQSLAQVGIQQEENLENIEFKLDETQAFEGTQDEKGQVLKLKEVTQEAETQTISVSFEEPVPPGTTLTISLQAKRNPSVEGVYLFRVSAVAAGDNSMSLDLGVGRLSFSERF